MKTIDATAITDEELEVLTDVERRLPDGDLREALRAARACVAEGRDVFIATESDLVSPNDASKLIGVSRTHLYKIMDAGDLPYQSVGRDRRVSLADVRAYLGEQAAHRRAVAERFAKPADTRAAALRALRNRMD